MRLLTKTTITQLIKKDELGVISPGGQEPTFLDDIRIGLTLSEEITEVIGPIYLESHGEQSMRKQETASASLIPGHFYLCPSKERLFLPNNVMGLINTRSKYARLGFELAKSSVYVTPGFGSDGAAPLVFEITVPLETKGISTESCYGFLLLFELEEPAIHTGSSYNSRFPLGI